MGLHRFAAAQAFKVICQIPGVIRDSDQRHYLKLVREVTCYNQAKIADYSFTVNESHKKLKGIYGYIQNSRNAPNALDYERLKEAYQETLNESIRIFKVYSRTNFGYMSEFYRNKKFGDKEARFCVKSAQPDGMEIITLAGSVPPLRESPSHPESESTAFSRVKATGSYLLCNNIPKEVKNRKFKNSRIAEADVFEYYKNPSRLDNCLYRFTNKEDKAWRQCWKRNDSETQDLPASAYYKSTLIVPLSIVTKELSDAFLRNFNVKEDKIVLGYLCLDHQNVDFFNEEEDLDFAYVIADQLSLYLIHHWMCTTYSSVFMESGELLRQKGLLS
jgi:hypothetical protein